MGHPLTARSSLCPSQGELGTASLPDSPSKKINTASVCSKSPIFPFQRHLSLAGRPGPVPPQPPRGVRAEEALRGGRLRSAIGPGLPRGRAGPRGPALKRGSGDGPRLKAAGQPRLRRLRQGRGKAEGGKEGKAGPPSPTEEEEEEEERELGAA